MIGINFNVAIVVLLIGLFSSVGNGFYEQYQNNNAITLTIDVYRDFISDATSHTKYKGRVLHATGTIVNKDVSETIVSSGLFSSEKVNAPVLELQLSNNENALVHCTLEYTDKNRMSADMLKVGDQVTVTGNVLNILQSGIVLDSVNIDRTTI